MASSPTDAGASAERGLAALRRLYRLIGQLTAQRELPGTLQAVVDGVVTGLGFGVAAVNVVEGGGDLRVAAVAGPPEVRSLLGSVGSRQAWEESLAMAEHWHALRFIGHGSSVRTPDLPTWDPPNTGADAPDAWHPEDLLLAPLHSNRGELIGVLSVDMPHDGRRPGPLQCELLEMFAAQASLAVENAALHSKQLRLLEQLRSDEARIRASEKMFRVALENSPIGMAIMDLDSPGPRMTQVNAALCAMLGYQPAELLASTLPDLVDPADLEEVHAGIRGMVDGDVETIRGERRYRRRDGRPLWVSVNGTVVSGGAGEESGRHVFLQLEDIDARKVTELDLARRAMHDPLTGLPNRILLQDRLVHALATSTRRSRPGALLYCDLDEFKQVNDVLGHEAGDVVLLEVTRRLQAQVRKSDTVARLGGDEFVLVLDETSATAARELATRILQVISEPIDYAGRPLTITASIGITTFAGQASGWDQVLREADAAMYRAKRNGKNRHEM